MAQKSVSTVPAEGTWHQEFFVRPRSDEANERISRILEQKGDVATFMRTMHLPGFTEKQGVYAIDKSIMDDIARNTSIRGDFKAFARYTRDGAIQPYRTPAKVESSKDRRGKRLIERMRSTVVSGPVA